MESLTPDRNCFIRNRLLLTRKVQYGAIILFSADSMLRNGDQFYPYRQNSDFYYLTGIEQKNSILLLVPHASDTTMREILFIEKPDPKDEAWNGKKLTPSEAIEISGVETIRYTEELDTILQQVSAITETFWFNVPTSSKLKVEFPLKNQRELKRIREMYPLHKYEQVSRYIQEMRFRKEEWEIALIRHASAITVSGMKRIAQKCRPDIPEKFLEAEFLHECTINNARLAFAPIIASGANACTLHYTENRDICKAGSLLLIDAGAEFWYYASDCTRTFPVDGRFTGRQKEVYLSVLKIYEESAKRLLPGKSMEEVEQEIRPLIEEEHQKLGLYTKNDIASQNPSEPLSKRYSPHGISHFLGLDVHDPGEKTLPLEPGMVLTCEPGIYIPEENIGIRIENTLLITQNGNQVLTDSLPMMPDEIESIMHPKG
ncbi:MAG TPA: aminopeptidase P N-terminal domain-containing protein [Bacteroidales bacterium]|nr:aminopeptidase P N-terminal domain-containing protein [Bacteroidales bacterium]